MLRIHDAMAQQDSICRCLGSTELYSDAQMAKFVSIDEYIGSLPQEVREKATALRFAIHSAADGLVETIRYDMPAFQSNGATVVYFAVWKKHIGLYPIYRGTQAFEASVGPFRAKTDTVQLPLNQPIPQELVAAIVESQMSKVKAPS